MARVQRPSGGSPTKDPLHGFRESGGVPLMRTGDDGHRSDQPLNREPMDRREAKECRFLVSSRLGVAMRVPPGLA